MGLRFHEKYLLLIGSVSLGLFLISGTLFYLSTTDFSKTHQNHRVHDLENIKRTAFKQEQIINVGPNSNFRPNLSDNTNQLNKNEYRRNYVKEVCFNF
jgi:hypothetical protein